MGTTKSNKKSLRQKEPPKPLVKRGAFRAPSSSSIPSSADSPPVSPLAGPSNVAKPMPPIRPDQVTFAKLDKPRKTAHREHSRAGLLLAAATAKKRQAKVKALPVTPPLRTALPKLVLVAEPWVHVSNLDPDANAADLADHFAPCGEVLYVNIRYSNSGVPGRPQLGYRYAIVKFDTPMAADAAVELNGTKLLGSEYCLVVEPDLLNLPEVQNLPEFREVARAEPALMQGLPSQQHVLQVPPGPAGNALQTASGVAVTSPVAFAKTKVWKPAADTVVKKKRKTRMKTVTVGGVQYSM
ncbi:hypothetical protein K438DRAFT_1770127 [Mycena galopus ATCC 62051]|nr:hypothetical protein K438DRAFT_1770127 [Mycena galopus ATCC 62051]